MKITINTATFLIDLLDKHKDKIYIAMRKDKYPISDILDFINGYMLIIENLNGHVLSSKLINGLEFNNFTDVLFEEYGDIFLALNKLVRDMHNEINKANQWELIGIKYALCLTRFYIKDVIFGNDTEVEDGLYMDIPDKDDPESYDWEGHGLYNFIIFME